MDVDAALTQAREAFAAGDYETAAERYADIDAWLSKGGYLPRKWSTSAERYL